MAERTCRCGKKFRRGKQVATFVDGVIRFPVVCGECAGRCIPMLAENVSTCRCGSAATHCTVCAYKIAAKAVDEHVNMNAIKRGLRKLAAGYAATVDEGKSETVDRCDMAYQAGLRDGFERAADAVDSGDAAKLGAA